MSKKKPEWISKLKLNLLWLNLRSDILSLLPRLVSCNKSLSPAHTQKKDYISHETPEGVVIRSHVRGSCRTWNSPKTKSSSSPRLSQKPIVSHISRKGFSISSSPKYVKCSVFYRRVTSRSRPEKPGGQIIFMFIIPVTEAILLFFRVEKQRRIVSISRGIKIWKATVQEKRLAQ